MLFSPESFLAQSLFSTLYDSVTLNYEESGEFRVSAYIPGDQENPCITALNDGGFVVTWRSYGQDGSSYGIFGKVYDANGNSTGLEFQINTFSILSTKLS